MKILYLTTIVDEQEYARLLQTKRLANPSNQNFHTNIIATLKKEHDVRVFSSHPTREQMVNRKQVNEPFIYPFFINIPLLKQASLLLGAQTVCATYNPDVIVVDALNITLLKIAKVLRRRFNKPLLAIVTDNPLNLSNTSRFYIQNIFKEAKGADGYIALTAGLNRLFNIREKPSFVFPGVLTHDNVNPNTKIEPYAFFAGALYERYGVKDLIDVFENNVTPYPLYIAGHGPLAKQLTISSSPNIKYLGVISPKEAAKYMRRAALCLNPRPHDEQIDLYSVPSKLVSYIEWGNVVLSTRNDIIKDIVSDNIYWLDNFHEEIVVKALIDIKTNYEQHYQKGKTAAKRLQAALSQDDFIIHFNNLVKKLS